MIIDTHAHIVSTFYDNLDEIIDEINNKGITVFNAAVRLEEYDEVIGLAAKYENFYAVLGIHPTEINDLPSDYIDIIESYLKNKKVIAIGEIGLDYYHDDSLKEFQKEVFIKQIRLAKKYKLPIIIHSRDAIDDVYNILKAEHAEEIGGIIHCFSGDLGYAKKFIEMNFLIGIGGIITFKNAELLKSVVSGIDLENITLETDAPFLAPVPNRGKINTSTNIPFIIKEIEKIKKISYNIVEETIYKNTRKRFLSNKE